MLISLISVATSHLVWFPWSFGFSLSYVLDSLLFYVLDLLLSMLLDWENDYV